MNKITVNQLKPVEKINADKILQDFDLFAIKVEKDTYPIRETFLSVNKSKDKILQRIVALDYSEQDNKKIVYCLCRKNTVDVDKLNKALVEYNKDIFYPHKLNKDEIKQMPQIALLQLFFNQIIDQNVLEGSSLTGTLYLLGSSNSHNEGKTLNIDEFSLNDDLVARISTRCFSQIRVIDSDRLENMVGKPRFKINRKTKQIRLAGRGWKNDENKNYYLITPPVKNSKPTITKFLKLAARNHYATFVKSKSGMLYRLLDVFNQQFGQYFSPLAFKEIEVQSQQLSKSQDTETKKLKKKIEDFSDEHPITIVDVDGDNRDAVEYLTKSLKKINIKVVNSSETSLKLNIIHNTEHYAKNNLTDLYHPSVDTQHITVENLLIESLNATLYSAVKELIIKNDLKEKSISLIDNQEMPTQFTFFKQFRKDNDKKVLQFNFLPDNRFEIKELKNEDFDNNPFCSLSDEEVRSIELVIKDEINKNYFKVERTDKNTLPNVEFYEDMIEFTNHTITPALDKKDLLEASQSLNDQKYDHFIKLVESGHQDQYSASDVVSLLEKAKISKKTRSELVAILTEQYHFIISVDSRSAWARDHYLNGLTDINYYQEKSSLYYNVGVIGKGMNMSINKGSVVRKISPIDLLNDEDGLSSKDIFDLIDTMLVTFVKYTDLTVLPFPEKYLNEYYRLFVKNSDE
ncbi:ATPase [Lactobacillus acidophilus]|uniref:ATPase n=1 Tax=Lactobacillus acidophilus TaxID=1579 RepID=UPI0021A69CD0|nr:ATPase [Lactobacillus acidophilus]MCT3602697.1 ATPase [Lactobacillus acidophilus]MCT3623887.1 ATPase [Lactobacillus acidophilus]